MRQLPLVQKKTNMFIHRTQINQLTMNLDQLKHERSEQNVIIKLLSGTNAGTSIEYLNHNQYKKIMDKGLNLH